MTTHNSRLHSLWHCQKTNRTNMHAELLTLASQRRCEGHNAPSIRRLTVERTWSNRWYGSVLRATFCC